MTTIQKAIAQVCEATEPNTKERNKALRAVRWVLQSPQGLFGALNAKTAECFLTDYPEKAQVFDGRDNEALKATFWSKQLGLKLVATIL